MLFHCSLGGPRADGPHQQCCWHAHHDSWRLPLAARLLRQQVAEPQLHCVELQWLLQRATHKRCRVSAQHRREAWGVQILERPPGPRLGTRIALLQSRAAGSWAPTAATPWPCEESALRGQGGAAATLSGSRSAMCGPRCAPVARLCARARKQAPAAASAARPLVVDERAALCPASTAAAAGGVARTEGRGPASTQIAVRALLRARSRRPSPPRSRRKDVDDSEVRHEGR